MKKAATDQLSVAALRLFARRSRSAIDVNNSARSWIDEHRLTIHVNVAVVIIRHRSKLHGLRQSGSHHDLSFEVDRIGRVAGHISPNLLGRIERGSGNAPDYSTYRTCNERTGDRAGGNCFARGTGIRHGRDNHARSTFGDNHTVPRRLGCKILGIGPAPLPLVGDLAPQAALDAADHGDWVLGLDKADYRIFRTRAGANVKVRDRGCQHGCQGHVRNNARRKDRRSKKPGFLIHDSTSTLPHLWAFAVNVAPHPNVPKGWKLSPLWATNGPKATSALGGNNETPSLCCRRFGSGHSSVLPDDHGDRVLCGAGHGDQEVHHRGEEADGSHHTSHTSGRAGL